MKPFDSRALARTSTLTMAIAIAGAFTTVAMAQDAAAPPPSGTTNKAGEPVQLDKVEVTGSRIKRVDVEGPAPVTVIDRSTIEKSGYTSVQDILRDLSQNTGGTVDQSFTFGFTPGAAAVDLRGFGSGRSLVLMDGRRLPGYPIGISGTDQFVDLSQVPTVMVERIEILTDGASAIYGSDAISGVINIITRKTVQGSTVNARVGGTDHGGYANQRYEFSTGINAADSSLAFFADYQRNNPLKISQRSYSKSDFTGGGNGSGYGSTFFGFDGQVIPDPECGSDRLPGTRLVTDANNNTVCRFDRTSYRQFIPEMAHASAALSYQRKFGAIDSYSRLSYFESKIKSQFEPNAYSGGEGFDPAFPDSQIVNYRIAHFGYVPYRAPNNPTTGTAAESRGLFQRRLFEYGPRQDDIDTRGIKLLTGLNGLFDNGFTWDVGLTYNREGVRTDRPNILSSVLDNEVVNNGLDLFATIPEDVILRTKFKASKDSESSNLLLDGTVTGPVGIQLPGGPVQVSIHADAQHEKYSDVTDSLSTLGDAFDGASSGGGNRNYYAIGAEFSLPVMSYLEVSLAGRYDKYDDKSDVGGAFSPRAAFKLTPIDTVYLRGSVGKSFRAPDLQRLFGGDTKAFDTAVDSPYCVAQGGTVGDDNSPFPACYEPVQSIAIRVTSNEDLKEERGTNANVGVGWEIVKDLTFKLDWYYTKLKNIVVDPSTQSILDNCAFDNVFCDQIIRSPRDRNGDGQVLDDLGSYVFFGARNQAEQKIKGFDGSISYDFRLAKFGKFRATYDATWVDSLTFKLVKGDPATEQIDFASIPEWRMGTRLDWTLNQFGAFVRADYVGPYPGATSSEDPPKSDYFSSFTTWDTQVRYDFGKYGEVRLGINNIFDKDMPLDPTATGINRPNQFIDSTQVTYHSALGREGYLSYEFQF